MLARLELTRTRAAVAALVATAAIGGFAIAWANASSPSTSSASSEAPGDISGPCDEAENVGKPECAGITPVDDTRSDDTTGGVTSTTSTSTTTGAPPVPTASSGDVRSFGAADAGTVTYSVNGTTITLIDAAPAAGWRVEVEQATGAELDLDFRSGTRRVQVDVEFEDGGVRERVRVRDDADDTRTEITNGTVTRVEDDDTSDRHGADDGSNSGPGSIDDGPAHDSEDRDDDDSRHGSDDDQADDDSGHGGDDDGDDQADDDSGHGGDDDQADDSRSQRSDD